jgi:hypothetical protein
MTLYHNSPSKKRSEGIASMISCGNVNLLPLLEKNAFLSGFQNPRTPSYFSNIHLMIRESQRVKAKHGVESIRYQLTGSTVDRVKKHAFVGSPTSST